MGIKSSAKSQFPCVALLACGLALAPSVWRWIDLEIYAFWTDGANTSVTLNVPPASSININTPLTPTVPALSPTALAIPPSDCSL